MAVEVKAVAAEYGQHYNTGSLFGQLREVGKRLWVHSFPGSNRKAEPPSASTPKSKEPVRPSLGAELAA